MASPSRLQIGQNNIYKALDGKIESDPILICCFRTKYPSEIYKIWAIIVGATKLFVVDLKGLNWAQFGSSDFFYEASGTDEFHLM